MNAPAYINAAHEALAKSAEPMNVDQVAKAAGTTKKAASTLLKALYGLGMIEMEPHTGGVPFYRLVEAPKADVKIPAPETVAGAVEIQPKNEHESAETCASAGEDGGGQNKVQEADGDDWIPFTATGSDICPVPTGTEIVVRLRDGHESNDPRAAGSFIWKEMGDATIISYKIISFAPADFATTPELKYLAPEDYEMPPADGTLAALRNLQKRFDAACEERDDVRARLDAVTQQSISDTTNLTHKNARLHEELDALRAELAAERQAREALQEQSDAVDVKDAAVGYIVRAPKRKPRYVTKPESARSAALAAVRAGAVRADVLAVVPVGTARRGAEWTGA